MLCGLQSNFISFTSASHSLKTTVNRYSGDLRNHRPGTAGPGGCCGLLLRGTYRIEELIPLAVGSAGPWWPQLSPSVGIVLCGCDLPHPRFQSLPGPVLWFWTLLKGHSSSRIPYGISCIWVQQMGFYLYCFIDYAKAFDCADHNKLENSERDGNTRPSDLPPLKPVCRSRSNS